MACAPKATRSRLSEADKLGDRAGELLDDAEKALNELDADTAESKLREADLVLKDPRAANNPDWALLVDRYKALDPRVAETRAESTRGKVAQRVALRRAVIAKSVKAFRLAIVDMEQNPADRATVEVARLASTKVSADIEWERGLRERDPDFKNYVEALKIDLQNAESQFALAQHASEFAEGPARDHDAALALARAKGGKKLEARLKRFQDARDLYRRCNQRAVSLIEANPGLERSAIFVSGRRSTAAAIAQSCDAQSTGLEKRIASTEKALAKKSAHRGGKKHKKRSRR